MPHTWLLDDVSLVDLSKSDFVEAKDIPLFGRAFSLKNLKTAVESKPGFIYARYLNIFLCNQGLETRKRSLQAR